MPVSARRATADVSATASTSPFPERLAALLRESRWFAVGALALFLILALAGYDPGDPGWSHATGVVLLHNPAGRAGAWISDVLLYLFGLSAWWWVAFLLMMIWRGIRRAFATEKSDRRAFWFALAGFVLLIAASSTLENLRFHTLGAALPEAPGGVLGLSLGHALSEALGYTGATLLLLAAMAAGWSLFSGMSWLAFFEKLGGALEESVLFVRRLRERQQDEKIGAQNADLRQAEVAARKEAEEIRHIEPVLIETPPSPPPAPPKVVERLEREKQIVLPEIAPPAEDALPPMRLLDPPPTESVLPEAETLEITSRLIERKLADFGITVKVLAALPGPVITRYEIEPATGVKGSQIVNLAKDLARALALISIRVVETVPGKSCMALELPNPRRQVVKLSEIIESTAWDTMKSPLTVTLGKDIGGQPVVANLATMPHLLVAGTTGSGKSVGVNAMILSMLYKSDPSVVRLVLIDPKMLELSIYEGIPHLLAPVVTDMKQAANALNWCVGEMERRYKLMSAMGVRNLEGFNALVRKKEKEGQPATNPFSLTPESPEFLAALPYIVVVIDELADLMMVVGKKVEELIARLAQKARAAGLHLILATQRPSADVLTGLIKANVPTRIAFQVSSKIDSRVVLDQMGAENLLGQGDMLYLAPGTGYPTRVHGAFVSDDEVHRIVEYLKQTGEPEYAEGILDGADEDDMGGFEGDNDAESDALYDQAVAIVLQNKRASISLVQRHLRIGYNRAARLIEAMERAGLVSSADSKGAREVIARRPEE
ncbi:MAG: DNA translocase FtsK 4TM domain-containing protein [Zoogloeaceae bacterium]|jgi:S-DNA-T family DNA segregation ATPase FtsK/SpoIIIE|nr:DNA translocase FtsK 4TM domain-containing protein [Zoogloeaceae bacterium]